MFKRFASIVSLCLGLVTAAAAVEVNTSTAQELTQVKGIGDAIAERIVVERSNQPYRDWSDFIQRVRGVGEKQAERLSDNGLTVDGTSYKGSVAGPEAAKTP